MINLLLLNNFYPVIYQKKKKATNCCIHGTVTRYGPRTSCQRRGLKSRLKTILQGNLRHKYRGKKFYITFVIEKNNTYVTLRKFVESQLAGRANSFGKETSEFIRGTFQVFIKYSR